MQFLSTSYLIFGLVSSKFSTSPMPPLAMGLVETVSSCQLRQCRLELSQTAFQQDPCRATSFGGCCGSVLIFPTSVNGCLCFPQEEFGTNRGMILRVAVKIGPSVSCSIPPPPLQPSIILALCSHPLNHQKTKER